ncbi:MAG: hypothetical protein Q9178_003506 [Gyalolechia marmorata]
MDQFDDPTHGYVNYVDQATADSQDLYNVSNGQVTWGVDHANIASGRGRNSIRLTSKVQPNSGEIDIIEGVNTASQNQMTMHTGPGCTLAGSSCQGGPGCPIKPEGSNNYGTNLNNAGGGVYAMEWTSGSINIWFFPRNGIPGDISSANPNPSAWGTPTASFVGGDNCNIDQHFMNHNIVFDTTFCGDWAGSVWSQEATCSALAGTCQEFVQNHPEAFADAYWTINSLKVYQDNGNAPAVVEKINLPLPSSMATSIAAPTQTSAVETLSSAAAITSVVEPPSTKSAPVYTATTTVGARKQNYNFYGPSKAAAPVVRLSRTNHHARVQKVVTNFFELSSTLPVRVGTSQNKGKKLQFRFGEFARLKAIEKSLDDTTKKTKYERGVESEPATEPWQLAFQRCEESRKKRNEHVRANYDGLDIDTRNSKIEWQKDYRRRHGEESNRKRREKGAKERGAAGVKKESHVARYLNVTNAC